MFFYNYLGFRIRSSRREFICRIILGFFVYLVLLPFLAYILIIVSNTKQILLHSFLTLAIFVVTLGMISASARRINDFNYSGWWQLLVYFPLTLLFIIKNYNYSSSLSIQQLWFFLPLFVSNFFFVSQIILFVLLSLIPGTKGKNKYGDPPEF